MTPTIDTLLAFNLTQLYSLMINVLATASTGIACTGMLYWLVKKRSMRTQKLEQMRKRLQTAASSVRKSARVTASIMHKQVVNISTHY